MNPTAVHCMQPRRVSPFHLTRNSCTPLSNVLSARMASTPSVTAALRPPRAAGLGLAAAACLARGAESSLPFESASSLLISDGDSLLPPSLRLLDSERRRDSLVDLQDRVALECGKSPLAGCCHHGVHNMSARQHCRRCGLGDKAEWQDDYA